MSRYYQIVISQAAGDEAVKTYTSFTNGQTDPNALQIEIDAPVAASANPMGDVGALVRIWGIPLTDIAQASNLNGMAVQVFAGMQKGLPLANPAQSGLIVQGFIFQAFGNWIGTSMTLDLQILPGTGSAASPKNIVLNWKKGQQLADAIKSTLSTAFPGYALNINISPNLVLAADEPSYHETVPQLAQYIKEASKNIVGGVYPGVDILFKQKSILVYDGTSKGNPKQIAFTDLIGQATWLAPGLIQVTCVMRADIGVGDYVKLPPGQVTINQASLSQFRQGSVFQGTFSVSAVRHIGNYRQAAAEAWVTTLECNPVPKAQGTVEITDMQTGGTINDLAPAA